ncbi:MAG: (d)CMP kinase [Spirochaetaceae bacterium]|jgi:cytidylate kinase|nr:(d)CMP kinase [Spirochaetaceae bacterium]
MVVAIDGPAGSGKSTMAETLARRLELSGGRRFVYVNSGSLYRAVTLACVRRGIDPLDGDAVVNVARSANIDYRDGSVFLDGEDVGALLRGDSIDRSVSQVSANVPVRRVVNGMIKLIAEKRDVIVEGRDMTTVVFPDAEARFYLDASPESRAKRRFDQRVSELGLDEIRRSIEIRDSMDRNKPEGSLKLAAGVTYIDTSYLTINQVYEKLERIIRSIRMNHGSDGNGNGSGRKDRLP